MKQVETRNKKKSGKLLAAMILLVMICLLFCGRRASAADGMFSFTVQGRERYSTAFEILDLINAERERIGQEALVMDSQLLEAAMQRAAEVNMVLDSHWRPTGVLELCGTDIPWVGANINTYAATARIVYNGWYNSNGHYANMTNRNARSVGIGVFEGSAVAIFDDKEATPVSVSGEYMRTRTVETKMEYCSFTPNRYNSIKYGETDMLRLRVTIENNGIPVEIDMSRFNISCDRPEILSVSESGIIHANKVGTANVTVSLKDEPSASCVTAITVEPFNIFMNVGGVSNATYQYEKNHVYTGSPIEPKVTVTDRYGTVLREGVDYTIGYEDNTEPGTGWILVYGKGNYTSTAYKKFTIRKPPQTEAPSGGNTGTASSGSNTGTASSGGNTGTASSGGNAGTAQPSASETQTPAAQSGSSAPQVTFSPAPARPQYTFGIKLSKKSYTYDGRKHNPGVTVYVRGKKLAKKYYSVTYKNNKNVGTATVTVKGKGTYRYYSATATYRIKFKKPVLSSLKAGKGRMTAKWKKDSQMQGYQLQVSATKKFKSGTKVYTKTGKKTSVTVKGLTAKKTYYVRIRLFKKVNGQYLYSGWSNVKKVKAK